MRRGLADAAPMISICCILFSNDPTNSDSSVGNNPGDDKNKRIPNSKKTWDLYKDHFLCALIRCAGRRFALGLDSSGCESGRGTPLGRTTRSSSFTEWDVAEDEQGTGPLSMNQNHVGKRASSSVEYYAGALRPMITLFASFDQLSKDFTLKMEDEQVEESAERLVHIVEQCQKADNIRSLLSIVNISMDDTKIIEQIDAGIKTV